ncbi:MULTISPECIES: ATP-binding protein [unclassified Methylophaga]|jgi:lon-related putative ATP-dependent protease|nr:MULTISPECIES: ATP-binding protein [unclassified Methylophaga]MAL49982.1 ATP-dependent protease [Methylophaga sp.]MBP25730.1 ATP-dependent protease [Methylophaga sp.]HCC82990.1 ATP-dependent protease [Methylophaga sp.]|tara:strand:- start:1730 stop:4123 length:2394 start_codon:yes stop_codon:yes gene_type:complete
MSVTHLNASQLYHGCNPADLPFKTTATVEPLTGLIGQDRAREAIEFAANIQADGYNLYVMGEAGMGKKSLVSEYLTKHTANRPDAEDWAYLHNFDLPQQPKSLSLPAGDGAQLKLDIERVIKALQQQLPHAFDDEYYRGRVRAIEEASRQHRVRLFGALQTEADKQGVVLLRMEDGSYAFAAQHEGEPLSGEDFEDLPYAKKMETEEAIAKLQVSMQDTLIEIHEWEHDTVNKITALNDQVALEVITRQIDFLRHAYPKSEPLQNYFDDMQFDIQRNIEMFLKNEERQEDVNVDNCLKRYQINLIVDNADLHGAPVVYLNQPNHQNLLGCVENMAMMGALVTDFTLIKAGALHRANGGFLIVDAEKLLEQPFAWEGLKAALKASEIPLENLERTYSLVATVSLEPEPIPLSTKVILLGNRDLYYQLYELDPEFAGLFKVLADLEDELPRTAETHMQMAKLIASTAMNEHLPALQQSAVALMIEYAARSINDGQQMSLHIADMTDLLREAAYWTRKYQQAEITADAVNHAWQQRLRRVDRVRSVVYQQIQRQIIQLDVNGKHIGQVNGLSVLSIGSFHFGEPTRITASCRYGDDAIIDIEREVELGGNLHAKGVMILAAYLGSFYAADKPLSMAASIVFEQNYGEIDGDSATVAELCALLSSIARIPLKQSIAITGSMNQFGQVQAIGGVNEKIEGFYDVCCLVGMTGTQGVIIPRSNMQHLMLKPEVRQSVENGLFHIYAVDDISDAINVLSEYEAGEADEQGNYPENSFNGAVAARLANWAELHKHDKDSSHEASD